MLILENNHQAAVRLVLERHGRRLASLDFDILARALGRVIIIRGDDLGDDIEAGLQVVPDNLAVGVGLLPADIVAVNGLQVEHGARDGLVVVHVDLPDD